MTRYRLPHIALHWLMALLIAAAFGIIWYADEMPLSPAKFQMFNYHKWAGVSVLILVLVRLASRWIGGAPAPLPQPAWQRKAAAATHHLLYLLMALVPLAGWTMSSAKGFPVVLFGLWRLPDLVSKNESLGHTLGDVHEVLAYSLLVLIVLHVAAAIKHHVIDRDTTLARMWPCSSKKEK
ncbi:cytochrome b [Chitinibacteraceae bacterium HSL-7]